MQPANKSGKSNISGTTRRVIGPAVPEGIKENGSLSVVNVSRGRSSRSPGKDVPLSKSFSGSDASGETVVWFMVNVIRALVHRLCFRISAFEHPESKGEKWSADHFTGFFGGIPGFEMLNQEPLSFSKKPIRFRTELLYDVRHFSCAIRANVVL
jgi:hypothetical protein